MTLILLIVLVCAIAGFLLILRNDSQSDGEE